MSVEAGKNAVLLLAHGTPDVLGEMAEYLSKVTGGRALPDEVVKELQHRYAQIGSDKTSFSSRATSVAAPLND